MVFRSRTEHFQCQSQHKTILQSWF